MNPLLPDAPWRHQAGLDQLFDALDAHSGMIRYVGGAVRDALLGEEVKDVDIATPFTPTEVMTRLGDAGIRFVPTGIEHGTVTAVIAGAPFEITTLRRDVSTDGRRATVAFSTDWREDAARRDFTINALFADPLTSMIDDYHGGIPDLEQGRVRFIGRAVDRIAEDHLRILRYFRFLARYGKGEPDEEAVAACIGQSNSLMALSRERIADELMKLLALPDPTDALKLMIAGNILKPVLPEIEAAGLERLCRLSGRERSAGVDPSAIRRLGALLPPDPLQGEAVAARLKLSNKARRRIAMALSRPGPEPARTLAYRLGTEGAIDQILLNPDRDVADVREIIDWNVPALPIGGGVMISLGIPTGPDVARSLRMVEEQWISEGFPDESRTREIAAQTVSKFQRARQ